MKAGLLDWREIRVIEETGRGAGPRRSGDVMAASDGRRGGAMSERDEGRLTEAVREIEDQTSGAAVRKALGIRLLGGLAPSLRCGQRPTPSTHRTSPCP